MFPVSQCYQLELEKLSVTQILREINFRKMNGIKIHKFPHCESITLITYLLGM